MSFLGRAAATAARAARPAAARGTRNMSGHGSPEEIYQAKELWFKTSIMAGAFIIIPYTAFVLMKEMQHEHHEKVDFPHMHQRHKAFPWKESDCALFDLHCKHEAHAH